MARVGSWIEPFPQGIYVKPADVWIDPSQPKPRALITHGHGDHARGGHGAVLATAETLAIMDCRYGPQPGQPMAYGEAIRLGDVEVTFVPAGHVLGSAQIVLEHKGERIVVSGDYKRRPDPTCAPFEPVPCDIFITEATFGLPVFRHPDTGSEMDRLLARLHANPERCVLVGAYALGKAQRLIVELRRRGHADPIYIHGALQRLCELYEDHGVRWASSASPPASQGRAEGQDHPLPARRAQRPLVAPPARPDHAMASGWMRDPPARPPAQCRAAADHLRPCRLGRAHAHHRELAPTRSGSPMAAKDALIHWCRSKQIEAKDLELVGYDDEDD
jgi:putative mRNA 3-end processing factor